MYPPLQVLNIIDFCSINKFSNVPRDKSVRDLSHEEVKAMMLVHCILTTAPVTFKNAHSTQRKCGAVPSSTNHK